DVDYVIESDQQNTELMSVILKPPFPGGVELLGPSDLHSTIVLPAGLERSRIKGVLPYTDSIQSANDRIVIEHDWQRINPDSPPAVSILWRALAWRIERYTIDVEPLDTGSVNVEIIGELLVGPHPSNTLLLRLPESRRPGDCFRAEVNGRAAQIQVSANAGNEFLVQLPSTPQSGERMTLRAWGCIEADEVWGVGPPMSATIPLGVFLIELREQAAQVQVRVRPGPGIDASQISIDSSGILDPTLDPQTGIWSAAIEAPPAALDDLLRLSFPRSLLNVSEARVDLDAENDGSAIWSVSLLASPDRAGSRPTRIDLPRMRGAENSPVDPADCIAKANVGIARLTAEGDELHVELGQPLPMDDSIDLKVSCPVLIAFLRHSLSDAALFLPVEPFPLRMQLDKGITASISVPAGLTPKGFTQNGPRPVAREGDRDRLVQFPALYGTRLALYVPLDKVGSAHVDADWRRKQRRTTLIGSIAAIVALFLLGVLLFPGTRDRIKPLLQGWPWRTLIVITAAALLVAWIGLNNETMLGAFGALLLLGGLFRLAFGLYTRRRARKAANRPTPPSGNGSSQK
ncbi:MAG: hypothetical protein P9M14_15420, partial [Candidatus Alcyoniella australis]|nr:hypothetical protein [Candidatus Alcyoniella australis]